MCMDLEAIRQWIPGFQMEDFGRFHTMTRLKWESVWDQALGEVRQTLSLTMESGDLCEIQLECMDVEALHFDGTREISGFFVQDLSPLGYESCVQYRVGDYEEEALSFYCSDIGIKGEEKQAIP